MTSPGSHAAGAAETHPDRSLHAAGIRDVAAAAGVSTATVSRALRGLPNVSQSTRQRILAAAANLGYVASAAASELARGRGALRAPLPDQQKRAGHPASYTARSAFAGPFHISGRPALPGRGTILVVAGLLNGAGIRDERGAHTPAAIEQLVQLAASANGFTAVVKFCNEAGMPDTVRAAAASSVGVVINTDGLNPASAEWRHELASAYIPTVEIRTGSTCDRERETRCCSRQPSACTVAISGAGIYGYRLAIDYLGTVL